MYGFNLESKFLGGMIGSALGDSIGELAFYYNDRASLLEKLAQVSSLKYTDDTAMSIGLAESLLSTQGEIECQNLGKIFSINYFREPFRGYAIGPPTIFKIVRETGISYTEAAQSLFTGTGSFGNGAAMRITSIGLFFYDSPELYTETQRSAIVTHTHPLGVDGAAALSKAIALVVSETPQERGKNWLEYLGQIRNFVQTREFKLKINQIKELVSENALLLEAAQNLGTNITSLESVPFAIFAFLNNPYSFKKCLLNAVLIPGDRDTIGAMVGALLGSYLGIEKIPLTWCKKLENYQLIENLAKQLVELKEKSRS